MPEADDLALLRDCLAGRPGAWEAFVARFTPLAQWVARRVAAKRGRRLDEAQLEDACQEAFLALSRDDARRLRQFRPERGRLASWVGLVARQAALKHLEMVAGPETVSLTEASAVPAPAADETEALFRQALSAFPGREAFCLRLLVERGLTMTEVARILRVSRQTAYQIRQRSLALLGRELERIRRSP